VVKGAILLKAQEKRLGIVWLKAGIGRELYRGKYPLRLGEENAKHTLLKYP
jgi:hypothetical protein